jgi:RDD family
LVVTPAATTYFLYHFVLEIGMHGRTPGKRMAGIHIVTRTGGSPGIGALLTRNVFRLVDSLPLLYGVGLVATFATRDHVRIGDLAAGTILVYERPDVVLPERATVAATSSKQSLRGSDAEVITELLMRWSQLESEARQHLAAAILARHGINAATADTELRAQLERLLRGVPT